MKPAPLSHEPWTPSPEWKGQDCFVIGGGGSLRSFDFNLLKGLHTIGCNEAFRLGPEIVQVCVFGDASWFNRVKWDLQKFPNKIVTNAPSLMGLKASWLLQTIRVKHGLHSGSYLGWNYSTGALAVNLGISLGARRIFLLGFDMKPVEGKSHWHDRYAKRPQEAAYQRFMRGFSAVQKDLTKFPEVRVINVTDGDSRLPFFPRFRMTDFLTFLHSRLSRTSLEQPCLTI